MQCSYDCAALTCRTAAGYQPRLPNPYTGQGINFRYLLVLRTSQQLAVSKCLIESGVFHMDVSTWLHTNTAESLHETYTTQGCPQTQHACWAISHWAYVPDPMGKNSFNECMNE